MTTDEESAKAHMQVCVQFWFASLDAVKYVKLKWKTKVRSFEQDKQLSFQWSRGHIFSNLTMAVPQKKRPLDTGTTGTVYAKEKMLQCLFSIFLFDYLGQHQCLFFDLARLAGKQKFVYRCYKILRFFIATL